ncbi:MAG: TolC family protein [Planctomycetes bacterium]|nr:TolC family protein [Planctomycetota bacterium]
MRRLALVVVGALLAPACASPDGEITADRDALSRTVADRVGAEFDGPAASNDAAAEASIAASIAALLEQPLTEASAVKIALVRNPRVRAAYEELGVKSSELVQAGLFSNPVFDAQARFFDAGTEVELGLAASFLDLFFVPVEKRVAAAERDAVKAELARRLVALTFDVRRSFVRVRHAQELVAIARHTADAAERAHQLRVMLHQAGNATDLDLARDTMAWTAALLAADSARADYEAAREPLMLGLGSSSATLRWRLADEVSRAHADAPVDAESIAIERSLDHLASRARVEALDAGVTLASWNGLFSSGSAGVVAKREPDGAWGVGPALSLALPLFDQGQARTAIAEALRRRELALQQQLELELRAAARVFALRLDEATRRLARFDAEYLPARENYVTATLQNYNAMQIGAFDVIDAQRMLDGARQERVLAARDAALARLDLDELLAGSLDPARFDAATASRGVRNASELESTGGHR